MKEYIYSISLSKVPMFPEQMWGMFCIELTLDLFPERVWGSPFIQICSRNKYGVRPPSSWHPNLFWEQLSVCPPWSQHSSCSRNNSGVRLHRFDTRVVPRITTNPGPPKSELSTILLLTQTKISQCFFLSALTLTLFLILVIMYVIVIEATCVLIPLYT